MLYQGIKYIFFLILQLTLVSATDCPLIDSLTTVHSCLSCNFLWEVQLNKCISACQNVSEFYNSTSMRCESCPEKCEICNDKSSCQQCIGSLKYNNQLNKCACTIDACNVCDLKGERCRQCANGYEHDINLKCVKSQPKILINPQQGISLKTIFNFSIVNTQISNQGENAQQSKQFKCFIIGINLSSSTNLSVSSGSCNLDTFLPTLHKIKIHIYEYTTLNQTGETTQTNHYVYEQNLSVVSSFSSLNNLWNYIQDTIKPVDSLTLQIMTLYEYSYLLSNNCQSGGFCLSSGNICYTPDNNCVCGTNSFSGMRDCSSMKLAEEQFYSYLNQVFNICLKSFKGLEYNISCPKPQTYELPNDEYKYIQFLLEKSDFFAEDNEFILNLRNSLTSIIDNQIIQKIYPYIISRYVSKYDKIFSKVDTQNNLLIVYNNINNLSIDFSILLKGQIPITFFEQYSQIINNKQPLQSLKSAEGSFQQLTFSNFPQNVLNKYTELTGEQFQYIKLANYQKQQITFRFNSQQEFNQNQMICLQANQFQLVQNTKNKEPLTLCEQMVYDPNYYMISCECVGDTFLFLNDNKNLYLTNEQYENILDQGKSDLKTIQQVEESKQNQNYIVAIVVSIIGAVVLIILVVFYIYRRKAKVAQLNTVDINSPPQSIKQKIQSSPETNIISDKQKSDIEKQIQDDEIGSVKIQIENNIQLENINQIKDLCAQNDENLEDFNLTVQKEAFTTKNIFTENQDFIQDKQIFIKDLCNDQIEQDIKNSYNGTSNDNVKLNSNQEQSPISQEQSPISQEQSPISIDINQLQCDEEKRQSQKSDNQNNNNSFSQIINSKQLHDTSIKLEEPNKIFFNVPSEDSNHSMEIKQNNISSVLPDSKSILFVENLSDMTLSKKLSSQNESQQNRQKKVEQKNQKHKLQSKVKLQNQISKQTSLKRKSSQIQILKKTQSQLTKQSESLQITPKSNNIHKIEENNFMKESINEMQESSNYMKESHNLMKTSTKSKY